MKVDHLPTSRQVGELHLIVAEHIGLSAVPCGLLAMNAGSQRAHLTDAFISNVARCAFGPGVLSSKVSLGCSAFNQAIIRMYFYALYEFPSNCSPPDSSIRA
jgi:hypothetical protein